MKGYINKDGQEHHGACVWLSKEVHDWVVAEAKKEERSVSNFLRGIIEGYREVVLDFEEHDSKAIQK